MVREAYYNNTEIKSIIDMFCAEFDMSLEEIFKDKLFEEIIKEL